MAPSLSYSFLIGVGLLMSEGLAETIQEKYQRALSLEQTTDRKVFRDKVVPHWFDNGNQFWYRNDLPDGCREFIHVHAQRGYRKEAFDSRRLAEALAQVSGAQVDPQRLPFGQIRLSNDNTILTFRAFGKTWDCDLNTYALQERPDQEGPAETLASESEIRPSRNSQEETFITFRNRTEKPIRIYWVDTARRRQRYAELQPGQEHRQHTFVGHVWLAADPNDRPLAVFTAQLEEAAADITPELLAKPQVQPGRRTQPSPLRSPDGRYRIIVRDFNLFLHENQTGTETPLTSDGTAEHFYTRQVYWSPDSRYVLAVKTRKGQDRKIHLIESSPEDQLQPKLHTFSYAKPGDEIDRDAPCLFDIESRKQIPICDALFPNPWSLTDFHWQPDSKRFFFCYNQRGHQVLRVLAVRVEDGQVQTVVEETSPTFIDYAGKFFLQYIDPTQEILWMSERDGWNHLYLFDAAEGRLKNQITKGPWVVRRVVEVDVPNRRIWLEAGGLHPEQDPYYIHLCRVNFDGTDFAVLTEGDGTHEVEFSPDRRFFLDRWSRVDLPPITDLRSSTDGRLICRLEEADWTALLQTGWKPPIRFAAKGRDGQTDIYGILILPTVFDPNEKYPVLEEIYAGPQGAFVPKAFGRQLRQRQLAELGFVVVQIDGMGTSYRSKAFHDVCWKNLGDSGFPDRIAWLKAAAEKFPFLDLSRVGIYGGSAGGQSALRALLAYGDFYKAAAADCGCHDNRMDKIWWNELWMGWPVGPHYEEQSNVTNASKLQGKLLLTVGELDRNVDPASTMQVVNALIKADKDFELLIVPGAGHGAGETPYAKRKRMDFFVRHLLGIDPPARN
jgi:dipeptidyl aminopeptidase/acylaminoacyl peptidase